MLRSFIGNISGGIALSYAVSLPIIILMMGIALDFNRVANEKKILQSVADSTALYTVQELSVAGTTPAQIEVLATEYVRRISGDRQAKATAVVNPSDQTVRVNVFGPVETFFPSPLGEIDVLEVSAKAQLSGQSGNICLIALHETVPRALTLNQRSRLTADTCTIYVNSNNQRSTRITPTSNIFIDSVIMVGGYQGNINGLSTPPITDAIPISDPLADRAPPSFGVCDHYNKAVSGTETLSPGVYCGGLDIDGGDATLEPGVYIIKDGPLTVKKYGTLAGENVGFYLTGDESKLNILANSTISLSAPKTGEMVSLLFFADPNNALKGRINNGKGIVEGHRIRSNDARRLVGTIYLPDDKLIVDGDTPVADQSEYTVVIAQAFELNNGPNLVIQTNYAASDIPVPNGVGPVSGNEARIIE
ncbi:MAG: Tad domain-containing protein [Pseudomonadota bacterium]